MLKQFKQLIATIFHPLGSFSITIEMTPKDIETQLNIKSNK
jgi:hypothetical protein